MGLEKQRKSLEVVKDRVIYEMKLMAALLTWVFIIAIPTDAADLKSSKLYTGTIKLLGDLQTILLAVEAVLVIVLMIWQAIKMQAAEDEEKPKFKKAIKSILITGIIIVSLTATVPLVLKYYA